LSSLRGLLRDLDRHDAYSVLGVDPEATDAAIRQAYREKARLHHPDRTGDSGAGMVLLNAAYTMLRDRRAEYDRHLAESRSSPADTDPDSYHAPSGQPPDGGSGDSLWDEPQTAEWATSTYAGGGPDYGRSLWDTPDHRPGPGPRVYPPTWGHLHQPTQPVPGYGGFYPNYGGNGWTAWRPTVRVHSYLWLAILAIALCNPCGIVGVVYATRVNSRCLYGDPVGARRASRRALQWSVASIVVSVPILVLVGLAGRHTR
jgi:hypothetical protein